MIDTATPTSNRDPIAELEAMKAAHSALRDLQPDAQERVLRWLSGALGVHTSVGNDPNAPRNTDSKATYERGRKPNTGDEGADPTTYTAFADLLGESQAESDADRALVGGYWFQVIGGAEDFSAQGVNDKLKDTGQAIGNITRAFERLKATKPQLVRQLQKAGKTQQARKKFKLTTAGIEAVERMLSEQA